MTANVLMFGVHNVTVPLLWPKCMTALYGFCRITLHAPVHECNQHARNTPIHVSVITPTSKPSQAAPTLATALHAARTAQMN